MALRTYLVLCVCCTILPVETCLSQAVAPTCPGPVHIAMQSGTFSPKPGVTFELKRFKAQLTPMGTTSPLCFGHFTDVSHADIFASNETVTTLFGEKLSTSDSKITDLKIVHNTDGATVSGKVKKLIPVFFSISGPVTTNGSEIRMDVKTIKAEGLPVKSLMSMLGEHLSAMLQLKSGNGIVVGDSSLAFSPDQVAHLRGHIASVSTSPDGLTIHYTAVPNHTTSATKKHISH